MSTHLNDESISAAVAGLELDQSARDHLETCVTCRRRVDTIHRLIQVRRGHLLDSQPDWQGQHAAIMARLAEMPDDERPRAESVTDVVPLRRRTWLRPVLAAAAAVLLAATALLVHQPWQSTGPSTEIVVEDVLAEVDSLLANDELPGFEALGPIVPDMNEIQAHYHQNGAS